MSAGLLTCRYRGYPTGKADQAPCDRNAVAGWTTCRKHYESGISRALYQRLLDDRAARPAQYQPITTPADRCPKCNAAINPSQIKCDRCWAQAGRPKSQNRKVDG